MNIDKENLKSLAEDATKLVTNWRVDKDHNNRNIVIGDGGWSIFSAWHTPDGKALANAKFAAAANPNAILSLLAEIDRIEAENEALRKDAERYRWLQKATPYRFMKTQEASTTDGGDVFYFHADRFDALIDSAMSKENS